MKELVTGDEARVEVLQPGLEPAATMAGFQRIPCMPLRAVRGARPATSHKDSNWPLMRDQHRRRWSLAQMNGICAAEHDREHRRRIRFEGPGSGKTLIFLTNNTTLRALSIVALWKSRWQTEPIFQWIKQQQHLCVKRFLRTSETAVKTQTGCAVVTYVLIALVRTGASCALQPDRPQAELPTDADPLDLFDL